MKNPAFLFPASSMHRQAVVRVIRMAEEKGG